MKTKLFLTILAFSQLAGAATPIIVKCHEVNNQSQFIVLHMNSRHKIIPVGKNRYIDSDKNKDSDFKYLNQPLNKTVFESIYPGWARNGFSLLTFVTTADSYTVGVSPDLTKGFLAYRDLGSGNGNSSRALVCKKM